MTIKVRGHNLWLRYLAKKSEINNGLNVLEHMYIKYDAYIFRSVLDIQFYVFHNVLTYGLEASQG